MSEKAVVLICLTAIVLLLIYQGSAAALPVAMLAAMLVFIWL